MVSAENKENFKSVDKKFKYIKLILRKHKKKLIFTSLFSALFITKLVIYSHQQYESYTKNEVTKFEEQSSAIRNENNKTLKHILFWTSFHESENWNMKTQGEEYLKAVNCPAINCIFTSNRKLLSSMTDYDALVFNVGESFDIYDMPTTRSDKQVYIMANQE